MPHLARVAPNGEILSWPLVEVSLTDHPASRDARITNVRSAAAHYQTIGAPVSAFKAYLLPPLDPSPEERAYAIATKEALRVEALGALAEYRHIVAAQDARLSRRR